MMPFRKSAPRAAAVACAWAAAAVAEDAPRPNIMFVLTDDLGYGDLGVLYQNARREEGKPAIDTPCLDALAAEGMVLDRHYCAAPVCAPSRASLLLGVHQGHANVRDNQFDKALEHHHTLGSVLREAGYATAVIGKWGLQGAGTPGQQEGHPLRRGFDYFFGLTAHLSGHYHYPGLMSGRTDNQGQPCALFDGATDITAAAANCYSTDLFTARAKKWIADQVARDPKRPFFLYLALTAPHAQLNVPAQAYPAGGGRRGGVQWTGTPGALINTASGEADSWIHPDYADRPGWSAASRRHATMVRRIDDAMGDLLQLLKDLGIDRRTLVVFTSDNGPHNEAGSGGRYTQDPRFFRSYAGMDGIKRDVWEAGIRVPALVRWPGAIPAGRRSDHPSQFHDWMPTLAELAGVPVPARSDGVSLVPVLTGRGQPREGVVYVEYFTRDAPTPRYEDFETARQGAARGQEQVIHLNGYKGVRCHVTAHAEDFRIFDTASDPKETTDLSGRPGVPSQQAFKDAVLRLRRPDPAAPRPYDHEPVPAVTAGDLRPGVAWRLFDGDFPWVPAFDAQRASASGTSARPDPGVAVRDGGYGMEFRGYLKIPADGAYTFDLAADTGAFLRLHGMQLLDADRPRTPGGIVEARVNLRAGWHPFVLGYRHAPGASPRLALAWSGEAFSRQPVPDAVFYHDE